MKSQLYSFGRRSFQLRGHKNCPGQWDVKGSLPECSGKYSSSRVKREYVGKRSATLFPFENSCFRSCYLMIVAIFLGPQEDAKRTIEEAPLSG